MKMQKKTCKKHAFIPNVIRDCGALHLRACRDMIELTVTFVSYFLRGVVRTNENADDAPKRARRHLVASSSTHT
jgi:hypothetical protein